MQILTVEHHLSLTVNDLTLSIHNVVVVKYVLSYIEVPALDLLLGRLDDACEHLGLDGCMLIHIQRIHHSRDLITAEYTHQIVLQRQEERTLAGVALTSRTSSQLVVDTS